MSVGTVVKAAKLAKALDTASKASKAVNTAKALDTASKAVNTAKVIENVAKNPAINPKLMAKALASNPELYSIVKQLARTKAGQKELTKGMQTMYPKIGPSLPSIGDMLGGTAGDIAGTAIGSAIGSAIMPGVGTAAGGIVGGLVGDKVGSVIGDKVGSVIGNKVSNSPKETPSVKLNKSDMLSYGPSKAEVGALDVALPIAGDAAAMFGNIWGGYHSLLAQAILNKYNQDTESWSGAMSSPNMDLAVLPDQVKALAGTTIGNTVANRAYTVADTLKRNAQNLRNKQFQAEYHAPGLFWSNEYVNSPTKYGATGAGGLK